MTVQRADPPGRRPLPPQQAGEQSAPPRYAPLSPTGGWPVLLPAVVGQRRRVWPWLVGVVAIVLSGVSGWVFLLAPAGPGQQPANTVPIGASYTYPSGLVVTVSDINSYSSTNQDVITSGETAYRGTVTLANGTANPVHTALMTIDVATGPHSDDRIFENAPPPTADIAPGQQLKVPFAFTVAKQASGPLQVTVTAVPNPPAVFTDATQ